MRYRALATDYDGTLAHDGHVDDATLALLRELRSAGRQLIMVTGRELHELKNVFPQFDLFDALVVENGGVIFWPKSGQLEVLGPAVPETLIQELNRLEAKPFSVGNCILASWRPHAVVIKDAVDRLQLDWHVVFNKDAVMVLPKAVSKKSGLVAAAKHLDVDLKEIVGVGDAENDFSFLRACGLSAAVANALPIVKVECDIVLKGDHGNGVQELIERMVNDRLVVDSQGP